MGEILISNSSLLFYIKLTTNLGTPTVNISFWHVFCYFVKLCLRMAMRNCHFYNKIGIKEKQVLLFFIYNQIKILTSLLISRSRVGNVS